MPQDGRRSVGYRPFVTCDDPKGVVECGTIRKSNKCNYRKMEPSSEARVIRPKSSNRAVHRGELGQASFQLLEVSKGAQKLNHMIESWSKGITAEGQPKDLAKDLLKGALDLQESLMVLGKLQAASKYVARLKRKQEKSDNSGLPCDLSHGREFGFGKLDVSPGDESSRKKIDELREAIRSGLARQKQLDQRKFESQLEIPSTSSSQSSSVNYDETIDLGPEKKAKGSNLIAKLMGLEEMSSKRVLRKLQDEKSLQQQKQPEFNIDVAKLKKPEPEVQADEPNRRTLKEVLETMQCKGLLKSNPIRKAPVFYVDDVPPIVLIKPSCGPHFESSGWLEGKEASSSITVMKSLKANEKFPTRRINREVVHDSERIHGKPQPREVAGIASCERRGSTLPKEEITMRQRERNAERDSNKSRHPSPPVKERVKKEKHEMKSGEIEKATKSSRRSLEKAKSKAKSTQQSVDQVKANAPVTVRPEDSRNCMKRDVSPQRTRSSRQDQTKKETSPPEVQRSKKTASNRSCGDLRRSPRKKPPANEPKEPTVAESDKNNAAQVEDGMKINIFCRNDPDKLETGPGNEDTQFTVEIAVASESGVADTETISGMENSPTVLSPSTAELGSETNGQKSDLEGSETGDHIKSLLLSSPSFLSHAEYLSTIILDPPPLLQKPTDADSFSPNERLLIDYANEYIECRTDNASTDSLFIVGLRNPRTRISLDNLLEEILKEIENLSSYCKFASDSLLMDGLYAKLQRDLSLHRGGAVSILWDAGWTKGFCSQDVQHVVKEVEETVLSSLIEETLIGLVQ
ncbi:hypothetical protein CDL15_Pgr012528 [Punica granatum]|uniref:DUF4378 domain-containing protein n=1 Tax=Punica granatum TaxID=22663 RepID=A0A218XZC8_PUNGR|nr:hypothetical protein CDL15_Pgr012528 [Punica granatum]